MHAATATLPATPGFADRETTGRATSTHAPRDFGHSTLTARASVASDAFTDAMRRLTSGVNIVTTHGVGGRLGLTVSAMTSLSASPPLLLACINRASPACTAVRRNGRFAVNVLNAWQHGLANSFAGFDDYGPPYDFGQGRWRTGITGAPLLADALATFDCQVTATHDHGSHTLFVGRVLDATSHENVPLLYGNRAYQRPHPLY